MGLVTASLGDKAGCAHRRRLTVPADTGLRAGESNGHDIADDVSHDRYRDAGIVIATSPNVHRGCKATNCEAGTFPTRIWTC